MKRLLNYVNLCKLNILCSSAAEKKNALARLLVGEALGYNIFHIHKKHITCCLVLFRGLFSGGGLVLLARPESRVAQVDQNGGP